MNTRPKIAVVEDHDFYRNGLCLALKRIRNIELTFEAANGKDFFDQLKANPVDIVFLDVMMPVMGGYEVTLELRKSYPDVKIIILTMLDEDDNIEKFIDAGVDGYLLKNIDHKNLEIALNAVIDGKNYYSTDLMSFFTQKLRSSKANNKRKSDLSTRELEILQCIYEGFSNQEIADKLFISIRTVTNHRYRIMQKTDSRNAAALINYGIRHKLLKI